MTDLDLTADSTAELAFQPHGDSGLISLLPADPDALATEGGDPPDKLHVTVGYLGKLDEAGEGLSEAARTAVEAIAAQVQPFTATVTDVGLLGHDTPPAVVLFLDAPGAHEARQLAEAGVSSELGPSMYTYPTYQPHLTLGYGLDPADYGDRVGSEVVIDRVCFTWGDEVMEVPLGGSLAGEALSTDQFAGKRESGWAAWREKKAREGSGEAGSEAKEDPGSATHEGWNNGELVDPFDWGEGVTEPPVITPMDAVEELVGFDFRDGQWFDPDGNSVGVSQNGEEDGDVLWKPGFTPPLTEEAIRYITGGKKGKADFAVSELQQIAEGAKRKSGMEDALNRNGPGGEGGGGHEASDDAAEALPRAARLAARASNHSESQKLAVGFAAPNATVLRPSSLTDPRYRVTPDGKWEGLLVVEDADTGDGRVITEGALSWRNLPLPLMTMLRNPEGGEGHAGAQLSGRIDWIERRGKEIWGGGQLDIGSEIGRETCRLMQGNFLRGVSADLDRVDMELPRGSLGVGGGLITEGRIMGATACPFPAFQEASIRLVGLDEDSLVASAAGAIVQVWTPWGPDALVASGGTMTPPVTPPRSWFDPPSAEELQVVGGRANQMSVGKDGRLFGIAAIRGTCHIGFSDQCVDVPRSVTDYAYFHTGEVECDDGSVVATGPIVIDTVHPSLRLAASDAQAFYADTGCALADVRMHDMTVGSQELVVYAGALRPTVSPTQLRTLRGSDGVSPDWRRIGGNLEQVALLAVNLSGFKVPALVASGGVDADVVLPGQPRVLIDGERIQALVAAGAPVSSSEARFTELAAQHEALLFELDDLRAAVAPVLAERRQARLSLALDRALAPRRARATAALDRLAAAMDATEQFAPAKRKSGWEAARKKHGEDAWNRNGPKKGESGASKKTEAKKTAKAKAAPAAGVAPRGRSEVMRDAQDANRDVQKLYRAAHEVGPDTVQPLDDLSDSLADVEYAAEQGLAGELAGAYRNAAERAGIAAEGFRGVKRGPGGVDYAAKLKTLQGDLQSEADRWDGVDRWE